MPRYQYRCQSCSRELEVFQKFTDPSLTVCPECDGELRKVFSAVGVVFKGSGFYATDSRKPESTTPAKSTAAPAASGGDKSSSGGSTTSAA